MNRRLTGIRELGVWGWVARDYWVELRKSWREDCVVVPPLKCL
jgi:hypothetical protein